MKKLLAVLLSLAMLTGVLTGCGGNDSGTKAGSEQDGKQANSGDCLLYTSTLPTN